MVTKNTITLIGTDNDGFRHRYSVKKNEAFKESFVKFMKDLDFDEKIIKGTFMTYDQYDNPIKLKISDFEDCIRHYQNKKYDVDVFYGKFKIIIVVRTKFRTSVIKYLEKKAKWIKLLDVKKIKEKSKSKIPLQKMKISSRML